MALSPNINDLEKAKFTEVDGSTCINVNILGGGMGGVENLSDLNDVAIGTLANGDLLQYSTGVVRWVNTAPSTLTFAASQITSGTFDAARIPSLDASKVTTGVFDIARIPAASLERVYVVADQTARYALTTAEVQNGDVVYQNDTTTHYFVVDQTNLGNSAGYQVMSAGTAASVAWTGITGKPVEVTQAASTTLSGWLTSTDWNTFNGKQNALSFGNLTESTSSVLTISGGTSAVIGSGTSIQVKQSSAIQSGFLSSTDWATFNSKQAALSFGNLTEATSSVLTITGGTGAVIGSGASIQVKQAATGQSGFLSSTDWNTFNNKQATITVADTASVDLTFSGNQISATVLPAGVDHGGLGGLSDDDHTGYCLLAGRSGGQIAYGSTVAGENLTLSSTSSSTKGKILLGSFVAVDEVNSRVGFGTTSPSYFSVFSNSVTDPAGNTPLMHIVSTANTITADTANYVSGSLCDVRMNQAGFNATNSVAGVRGYTAGAYASGASGTVTGVAAFQAASGNLGAGTVTFAYCYYASAPTNSGGGTITNAYGLYVANITGATNNYGVMSQVASGTGKYNIYAGGTARNYFNGNCGFGSTVADARVHIAGNVSADAWATSGIAFRVQTATYTDQTSSGVVASVTTTSIAGGALAATNSTTYTVGAGLRVSPPTASTNVVISRPTCIYCVSGSLSFTGNYSSPYLGVGAQLYLVGSTYTDTTSTGTASLAVQCDIRAATFDASNSVTYTTAASLYISNAPIAGSANVTFTNAYALMVNAGKVRFNGDFECDGSTFNVDSTNNRAGIGTATPAYTLDVNGTARANQFMLSALNTAPASATATGTLGEIRIDASYIYICTATNTWKRVAIATW